jgi:hypothetical protein
MCPGIENLMKILNRDLKQQFREYNLQTGDDY